MDTQIRYKTTIREVTLIIRSVINQPKMATQNRYKPTIREVIVTLLNLENIKTKQQLYRWCGERGYKKLYDYVKEFATDNWNGIKTPKNSVCFYLRKLIIDY